MKNFAILAGILLTVNFMFFPVGIAANLMSEENLGDDTEETDSIVVDPQILEDIEIYLRSPRYSASRIATEEDLDSDSTNTNCIKTINEIRFDGWTEDDFFNNDYLRAFRRYMNTWLQGKEMDDTEADPSALEPLRERLGGKFITFNVREFSFGGLLYILVSVDNPFLSLRVWIYSVVNDGHITAYQVQYVEVGYDAEGEEEMRKNGDNIDMLRQWLLENSAHQNLW